MTDKEISLLKCLCGFKKDNASKAPSPDLVREGSNMHKVARKLEVEGIVRITREHFRFPELLTVALVMANEMTPEIEPTVLSPLTPIKQIPAIRRRALGRFEALTGTDRKSKGKKAGAAGKK